MDWEEGVHFFAALHTKTQSLQKTGRITTQKTLRCNNNDNNNAYKIKKSDYAHGHTHFPPLSPPPLTLQRTLKQIPGTKLPVSW